MHFKLHHEFQSPKKSFQPLAPSALWWEALECHSSWPTMEAHQGGRGCACKRLLPAEARHRGPEGQTATQHCRTHLKAPKGPAGEVGCLLDGSNIKLLILDRCSTYFAIVWQSKATDKLGDLICVGAYLFSRHHLHGCWLRQHPLCQKDRASEKANSRLSTEGQPASGEQGSRANR